MGDERVNGGLCHDHVEGQQNGRRAIHLYRLDHFKRFYFYDTETSKWYLKGTRVE